MPTVTGTPAGFRLSWQEAVFLGGAMTALAILMVLLGKDTSWDFRNYHWYNPYALFNDRMKTDLLVAHGNGYSSPYIDVPFYFLATRTTSWLAIFVLSLFQAANIVPLYWMARSALSLPRNRLTSAGLAFFSLTGGMTIFLFGSQFNDNVTSVFALGGLCILVVKREALTQGRLRSTVLWCALGGLLAAAGAALKLTAAPFALGYGAALLAIGGDRRHLLARIAGGMAGGLIGIALVAGPWMTQMVQLTGNPVFPYFNQYFHSPLLTPEGHRDLRFVPHGFLRPLIFPILFTIQWSIADDAPHGGDMRILVAYFALLAAVAVWLLGKRSKAPLAAPQAVRIVFVFCAASYFFWIKTFAIYRYIVGLEMLAPLVIVMAVALMPGTVRTRLIAMASLLLLAICTEIPYINRRAPIGDPYVTVDLPAISDPDRAMVLMAGKEPTGFIAPSLPPQIPVLRISGWIVNTEDGSLLTRQMKARVAAHTGQLYLIAVASEMPQATQAVTHYGLAVVPSTCQTLATNMTGSYRWCPLNRRTNTP